MSDISIPGVTNKFNTTEMIKELVKAEKVPLDRMEEQVSSYKEQKKAWQEVRNRINSFQESARRLYSFQNPFNDRVAQSSNSSALTATATREAEETSYDLQVLQKAQTDKFLSDPLSLEHKVSKGSYQFSIGEETIKFSFSGGSLKKFAEVLNQEAKDILKARVVKNTSTTQVMLIESTKTGRENRLKFEKDAIDFGLQAGLLQKTKDRSAAIPIQPDTIDFWKQEANKTNVIVKNDTLTLHTDGSAKIPVTPQVHLEEGMELVFELNMETLPEKKSEKQEPAKGPEIPDSGTVNVGDVIIHNKKSRVQLPEQKPPGPSKQIEDMQIMYTKKNGDIVPLPKVSNTEGFQEYSIPITEFTDSLDTLYFQNRNTSRKVQVRNIHITASRVRGNLEPKNPITEAQNAKLILDGVRVERESNTIDDLVQGITLNVHNETSKPINLEITPDRNKVKDAIINFIGNYNQLLTKIHILTRNEESVIDEIEYFDDEQREKAMEQLGLLNGNLTLMQLRTKLKQIMMNPYPTSAESDLTLLAQMGISTNTSRAGGKLDTSRLKGYLELDEEQLDRALEDHFQAVKELFGTDTDGDFVIDSGIAHSVVTNIRPYIQTGGLLATKINTVENRIERTNDDIEDYREHLDRYESELKRKYSRMEGALNELEESSQVLEGFMQRNSNQ